MKCITPQWPAPANVKAFTTTKPNWGGKQDDLKTLYDLPSEPIWLKQIHSTDIVEALHGDEKIADASFTTTPKQICVVLTADCLPVLICNRQGTIVSAIHAGWRGLANGILETSVAALNQAPEELLVWLGPAIGPTKFEVGRDVYEAFTSKHAISTKAFTAHAQDKWLANLYELAKIRLNLLGIKQIFTEEFCTFSQDDLFFSYRRDKGNTGRMASLIWLDH
jgi:YfiH family protein